MGFHGIDSRSHLWGKVQYQSVIKTEKIARWEANAQLILKAMKRMREKMDSKDKQKGSVISDKEIREFLSEAKKRIKLRDRKAASTDIRNFGAVASLFSQPLGSSAHGACPRIPKPCPPERGSVRFPSPARAGKRKAGLALRGDKAADSRRKIESMSLSRDAGHLKPGLIIQPSPKSRGIP